MDRGRHRESILESFEFVEMFLGFDISCLSVSTCPFWFSERHKGQRHNRITGAGGLCDGWFTRMVLQRGGQSLIPSDLPAKVLWVQDIRQIFKSCIGVYRWNILEGEGRLVVCIWGFGLVGFAPGLVRLAPSSFLESLVTSSLTGFCWFSLLLI